MCAGELLILPLSRFEAEYRVAQDDLKLAKKMKMTLN